MMREDKPRMPPPSAEGVFEVRDQYLTAGEYSGTDPRRAT